ncbi:hypothetical protein [Candidatus Sororendozoicomonas aggregata]|uniref:hypothetical protein n=1 Tax=Candidatus Sororendozoicomonas aggregata TaxID=3073239 RepID=UPI002ED07EDB
MKKYILYFSLPALIMWAASNGYASSCKEDFNAMREVIYTDGYVTTKYGFKIGDVYGPVTSVGDESCGAGGFPINLMHYCYYKLSWKRGKWRATLIATLPPPPLSGNRAVF